MNTNNKNWFILLCKPGCDEIVSRQLSSRGYDCYRPLLRKVIRKNDGNSVFETRSLFPRYLFLYLTVGEDNFVTISYLNGVSRFLVFGEKYPIVPDRTIECIRNIEIEIENSKLGDKPVSFTKNENVYINSCGFNNVKAVFSEPVGKNRSLLLIKILSFSKDIVVDNSHLTRQPISNY